MQLHLGYRGKFGSAYDGYIQSMTDYSLDEHFREMMKMEQPKGLFSTRVSVKGFMKKAQHVLAMDLDGVPAYNTGVDWLDQCSIDYAVMESTPGRYWVFANYVSDFKTISRKLEAIPGVDTAWLEVCRRHGYLMFRAFPKCPGFPLFCRKPLSIATTAGQWFYQVRAYFTSFEYLRLHDKLFPPKYDANRPKKCGQCGHDMVGAFCARCGRNRLNESEVARNYYNANSATPHINREESRAMQAVPNDWGY